LSPHSKGLFKAALLRNESLSPTCSLVTIERPGTFPDAQPGQFVSIRITDTAVPLLRRPFSVLDLTEDTLSLLVKVVGRGSAILAARREGDLLDLLGPLGGTPYPEPPSGEAVFVAGGTGLAPVLFAARRWRRTGVLKRAVLCYGATNRAELLTALTDNDFDETWYATIDGSVGFHGDVVTLYGRVADELDLSGSTCYSCGPREMVRALYERMRGRINAHYTSLEAVMACGVGACRGCTVPVSSRDGDVFKAVCSDGTVFRAGDIRWEEWEE
jgi:dihydroorotate dehydrogenase electron transfer subunit